MSCNLKFIKILAAFVIGFWVVSFSLTSIGDAIVNSDLLQDTTFSPALVEAADFSRTAEPMAYLFQILFILFIISPPLIALMLFLILKELKARNKMK